MRKLITTQFISLDGVTQAPGNPSEDPDGFAHGGWTRPYFADHRRYMPALFHNAGGFVFGRRTYDIFASYWPTVTNSDDEIARALNTTPKYVASQTLTSPAWQPTTVLTGDAADEIATLKRQADKDLVLVGSSQLAHTLIAHQLVDEYQLWVHPVVLGSGKRLFPQQDRTLQLALVDSQTTAAGVVILTYRSRAA
jgi:dihydrofolate reductase